jgi:hypothetical protein
MKRILISVIAALPLAIGPAVANAHGDGAGNGGLTTPVASVAGTVVSSDATDGTFVADAVVLTPRDGARRGDHRVADRSGRDSNVTRRADHASRTTRPATTEVTITTDSGTKLELNHHDGTAGDLVAGEKFVATFNGVASDSIQTLVSNPALRVSARMPREAHGLYAFVGMVTAVDATAGNVTVDVTRSRPSDLVLPGSEPVSFTVGPDTKIKGGAELGGPLGASLGDVSVGDVVAGGVIGDPGLSLSQVETAPLKVLVDLRAGRTSDGDHAAKDETRVMKHVLTLLGDRFADKSHGDHGSDRGKHAAQA